jgi:hypothetical protein
MEHHMRFNEAHAIAPRPPGEDLGRRSGMPPAIAAFGTAAGTTRPDAGLLTVLKARLQIFLYRHPVDDLFEVIGAIENAESPGEIQLLLDYVLARRAALPAT